MLRGSVTTDTGHDPGFGVYVHWPFCETICPYCDFNVHVADGVDDARWRDALLADLAHVARDTTGRTVTSLYFGGGTPSLMAPATVSALVEAVAGHWRVAEDIEITLETNPTSAEAARLADFRAAGVNRLSVGLQALDDAALVMLGRTHTAAEGLAALDAAHGLFDRITLDLIYARPGQDVAAWERELGAALTRAGGHVSLYQLTIEPGTAFARAGATPGDEDVAADLYEATQAAMADAGYPAYEVSNHARPGDESRHNLTCWRGGDYIGIGPGAHGRLTLSGQAFGTHQIHNPKRWLAKVGEFGHGTAKRRPLARAERAREMAMMGLRLVEGIDKDRFQRVAGCGLGEVLDADAVRRLAGAGLIVDDARRLRASADGRLRLNAVLAALLS